MSSFFCCKKRFLSYIIDITDEKIIIHILGDGNDEKTTIKTT